MDLDYNTIGEVNIDMRKYVENMIDEFPVRIEKPQVVTSLETYNLFKVDGSKPLNKNKSNFFIKLWLVLSRPGHSNLHGLFLAPCRPRYVSIVFL